MTDRQLIPRKPTSVRDAFIEINLHRHTADIYYHRTSLFRFLRQRVPTLRGHLLDVGCGRMPYRDFILSNSATTRYIGIDLPAALTYDEGVSPDAYWNGHSIPFPDDTFDTVLATEVLEHCPDTHRVLVEIRRVLRPGGVLLFTVPFLWPLHEIPHDEYRFTPFALERELRAAHFSDTAVMALGGWHASMAQMLGLWVRRAPMASRSRRWLARAITPVQRYLIAKDRVPATWKESAMPTGLAGYARK